MFKKVRNSITLLILINAIVYHRWLNFSYFAYSDWLFYFKETLQDFSVPTVWSITHFFTLGNVDITLWRLPIYIFYGLFGYFGYDFNVAEKFLIFWVIVFLLPIGSFLLLRYIIKSNRASFIGSLVFSFNTYFLSIDTQGHQFLTVAFAFATFTILFYLKLLEERKLYFALLTGIFLFIVGFYDLRSLYITVGILGLYLLYFTFIHLNYVKKNFIKVWGLGVFPFLLFFLLSLYWLLPILNVSALTGNAALGRQIFGSEFYNLQSSLTTFFPFWTGKVPVWFTVQQLPWYFWLYPTLAILGLIVSKNNAKVVFFGLIAVIGIFLSKQADIPFTYVYGWLYENFPGFNAFREASKFDFMISLGYAILIGGLVAWIWSKNLVEKFSYGKYAITITVALLLLWNVKPIVTGEIGTLYTPTTPRSEYVKMNEYFLSQQEFFRTLWINMDNHWITYTNLHPQLGASETIKTEWEELVPYNNFLKRPEGEKIITVLQNEKGQKLLKLSSIKYIIVSFDQGKTSAYGIDKTYYYNALNKLTYLSLIPFNFDNLLVYENKDYRPHIYITDRQETRNNEQSAEASFKEVKYRAISPSEYKVRISNIQNPVFLNFTDNFHPSWKIRVEGFQWFDVITNNNYFLPDSIHTKSDIGFNAFVIDPENVCREFNCVQNDDGSYDIEMTLYFKPQSYLYLGMIISGTTLILCVVYLLYYGIKKAKTKS